MKKLAIEDAEYEVLGRLKAISLSDSFPCYVCTGGQETHFVLAILYLSLQMHLLPFPTHGRLNSMDIWFQVSTPLGFPDYSSGEEPDCQCRRPGFNPWVGKISWRRKWQPTPVLLPGKSHGWRSLVGYSPWGRKESDMTERLHFTSLLCAETWAGC